MFVPWTKEKVIAKMSHTLEPYVMFTWVGYTEHKKMSQQAGSTLQATARHEHGFMQLCWRLRLEIHLHLMKTHGSLLGFCIVQCLFVPTFRKNVPKSPLKLTHPKDGCDIMPWNVETSVLRCKCPKHDYQRNNNHLETLRTNMDFQFLPQRTWTAVAQWLRCCATNRKVAGLIPAGVSGFFIEIKSFRSHYGPGVDSTSTSSISWW